MTSEFVVIDQAAESRSMPRTNAGVSVETALYSVVFLMGTLLRWLSLGLVPLSLREAEQALAALNNTSLPVGGSPLLFSFNQILFGLFGNSLGDAGPRLGAAVIGTALILLPWLYRDRIGRVGALAASTMLAISPTFVFASRLIDGTIVVVACASAALGFGLRFIRSHRSIDLVGLAISIGVGLTSGPSIVTLLIVIGLGSSVVLRWIASKEADEVGSIRQSIQRVQIRRAAWWGGGAFILVATVALTNPSAIRFEPENFSAWLQAFRATPTISAALFLESAIIYEPLIICVGLLGLFAVLVRVDGTSVLLALWAVGSTMIVLLQPGHQAVDILLALTPLTLLAGMLIQSLTDSMRRHAAFLREGLVWLIGLPLAGYLVLLAASTAISHQGGSSVFLGVTINPLLSFIVTAALLLLLISAVFVIVIGAGAMLRAASSVIMVVLALISIGSAWSVNQLHVADPRELLWGPIATTSDVGDLRSALHAASDRFTGDPNQISISVVAVQPNPILEWYLRDFKRVKTDVSPDVTAQAVIVPQAISSTVSLGNYYGASFAIRSIWSLDSLQPNGILRWWLYRDADRPAAFETVTVWIKANQP
ncbi:MAG TPA: glycosyltransferase family 39 protein [Anaerolineae bacterium]|nr:glycosyltransferase family 39 protein [Anaerolineae bacterium]